MRATIRAVALALLSALLLTGAPAIAADSGDDPGVATRIKAAFIRHFCTYIDWPDSEFAAPDDPIVLGVMGSGAMVDVLRGTVANRTAHDRPMVVRQMDPGDELDDLHLLFIADSMRARIPGLAAAAAEENVLVVTESAGALASGSAINFIIEDDRVKFDIAPATVRRAGLDVSAQLLTVARVVGPEAE